MAEITGLTFSAEEVVRIFASVSPFGETPTSKNVGARILAFEQAVLKDISEVNPDTLKVFHNTTGDEKKVLQEIANNNNIVLKPADKGGAIVIQTTENYQKERLRLLGDTRNYEKLKEDPTELLKTRITSIWWSQR
ncbi:hypothetical protein NDU88_003618 [Pleurodeles waltl]|uniref:Uncharacterized protein n=1 Tax=Pleurodeles waltl TaxID=8319 RepID=A0AAV7RHY9_PLEWA|nr:hypothetical protein NDU88_003618 [Pleurodeles waltl]